MNYKEQFKTEMRKSKYREYGDTDTNSPHYTRWLESKLEEKDKEIEELKERLKINHLYCPDGSEYIHNINTCVDCRVIKGEK